MIDGNSRISLNEVDVSFSLLTIEDYNLKRTLIAGLGRKRSGKSRNIHHALADINLEIVSGDRLAVMGLNGSGKSTLLRVMAGTLPPTSGQVEIYGDLMSLLGGSGASLDGSLTGYENIMTSGILLGASVAEMKSKIEEIAEFSGLGARINTPVATYSAGMQARLRFAITTSMTPQILIMDEGVASSSDPDFAHRAKTRLTDFGNSVEILIVTSHGSGITDICNKGLWLADGKVQEFGQLNEVLSKYQASFSAPTESISTDQILSTDTF
jgi:ABC-type polysaccharide/polyol phosphate transport system ATPase subunit